MNDKYLYPTEKLGEARRRLMLPHPDGVAKSVADAYAEYRAGLMNLSAEDLDERARGYKKTIDQVMDASGIVDPAGRGTAVMRAEQLAIEDMYALSGAIDELAFWFYRRLYEID